MRLLGIGLAFALAVPAAAVAETHYVQGHVTKDGTYVAPHYQTDPNSTRNDNWSTRGNTNPYTGQAGTKPRDEDVYAPRTRSAPAFGSSYGAPTTNSSYGSTWSTPSNGGQSDGGGDPN